jgi:hypothetical protein
MMDSESRWPCTWGAALTAGLQPCWFECCEDVDGALRGTAWPPMSLGAGEGWC